jgi:hypothetical protein
MVAACNMNWSRSTCGTAVRTTPGEKRTSTRPRVSPMTVSTWSMYPRRRNGWSSAICSKPFRRASVCAISDPEGRVTAAMSEVSA